MQIELKLANPPLIPHKFYFDVDQEESPKLVLHEGNRFFRGVLYRRRKSLAIKEIEGFNVNEDGITINEMKIPKDCKAILRKVLLSHLLHSVPVR